MSAKDRFFKKVQRNNSIVTFGQKSAEAEIREFTSRVDDLADQINQWFAGTTIDVTLSTKYIHDLSTLGYSLSSGICRYDITTIHLQNGDRSVRIIPEQLCRGAELGFVIMHVDAPGIHQVFYLSMAPEAGWFIRGEHQSAKDNAIMTEDRFFAAVDRLA